MKKSRIHIAIIDDHQLLAESLAALLERESDLKSLGIATEGEAGFKLCLERKPDLVLLDVSLPKINGLDLIYQLRKFLPNLKIVILSGHRDPYTIWQVAQADVHGFINQGTPVKAMLEAIRRVAYGNTFFCPEYKAVMQDWLTRPEAFQNILSQREIEVMRYAAEGLSDERIAKMLKVSILTVFVQRRNIRVKLRIHNEREMMAYARVWGLGKAFN